MGLGESLVEADGMLHRQRSPLASCRLSHRRSRAPAGGGHRPARELPRARARQPLPRFAPRERARGRDCAGSRRLRARSGLPSRGARSRPRDVRSGARGQRADAGLWHGAARGEGSRHRSFRPQPDFRPGAAHGPLASSWFSSARFATAVTPAPSRPMPPPPRSSRPSRQGAGSAGAAASTGRPSSRAATILPWVAVPPLFLAMMRSIRCSRSNSRSASVAKGPRPRMMS